MNYPQSSAPCRVVKVAEAAERTGLSRKQIATMIRTKQIRARKLNPHKAKNSPWIIPEDELKRVLQELAA